MIRTAWIGGSYQAATRCAVPDLPAVSIKNRHAEPGMGADVPLLKLIKSLPGSNTEYLLSRLSHIKSSSVSRALFKMRAKQLIHSVKISVTYGNGNQRRPACLWYPGPAPVTVNHMTVGRPRTGVQP